MNQIQGEPTIPETQPGPCINCGTENSDNFCPNCGQRMTVKKVSWKALFFEISNTYFGLNNQFARTVVDLTRKPGEVMKRYLDGNRVRYIGPLSYLIIMSALYILSFQVTGVDIQEFMQATQEDMNMPEGSATSEDQVAFQQLIQQKIADNFRLVPGLLVPFLAIGIWIVYRKKGTNYLQNVVLTTFALSHLMWLSIVVVVIYAATGYMNQGLGLLAAFVLYGYFFTSFYRPKKYRILGFLRTILGLVLGYVTFFIFAAILGIVAAVVTNLANK